MMRKNLWFVALAFLAVLTLYAFNLALGLMIQPSDAALAGGITLLVALGVVVPQLGGRILKRLMLLLLAVISIGCARVEPGHVGIKVNMWGSDRGVESLPIVTGGVAYNPITTSVYEYPTYVQTGQWQRAEGAANEEITFNSKEGMLISGDISLSYQLTGDKVPAFYVKFRSDDLDTFTHGFLRNVARDAFNETAVHYTVEEIYGPKKEEFITKVRERINTHVSDYGVVLQQFGFMGAVRLPNEITATINAKLGATQKAIQVENELRQAEAEAKKRVANAEGEAKSRVALAEGEARANRVLSESLSAPLLEWRRLAITERTTEKWDGKLPQISAGGATPLINIPSLGVPQK